jgi:CubicO group peptidase (beta-lactamase class C family)
MFGSGLAIYRRGTGCAVVPDGDTGTASSFTAPQAGAPADFQPWPQGAKVDAPDPAVAKILADASLTGPGMRGVVVVKDGRIVGETYGERFGPEVPLLGWSMTKTVNAAIIGTVIADGLMTRDETGLFPFWKDERGKIGLPDMMAMASGLEFNEDYGDVTDVTRMLYVEPDMASFAAHKPLIHPVGTEFSYSSGTAVMLSRIWQDAIGDEAKALAWPREHLFDPLGMGSAVLEADARGTFVGSSYMYATARDWARFGLFLLQDGKWNGRQILPEGYVQWMRTPSPAYDGYGRQVWMEGPEGLGGDEHPDAKFGVPEDAYWMIGHDGQTTAIIPSAGMVVVRLGLTPSKLGYQPQGLVGALVKALR